MLVTWSYGHFLTYITPLQNATLVLEMQHSPPWTCSDCKRSSCGASSATKYTISTIDCVSFFPTPKGDTKSVYGNCRAFWYRGLRVDLSVMGITLSINDTHILLLWGLLLKGLWHGQKWLHLFVESEAYHEQMSPISSSKESLDIAYPMCILTALNDVLFRSSTHQNWPR